jgi:hypothetical protein
VFGQSQGVMIWVVTATTVTERIPPGQLQQVYAADPAAVPGRAASLIGEKKQFNSAAAIGRQASANWNRQRAGGQDDLRRASETAIQCGMIIVEAHRRS